MVITSLCVAARPDAPATIVSAKEVTGDCADKGEGQTEHQADRVDNHKSSLSCWVE
jgi:hypothetical protein